MRTSSPSPRRSWQVPLAGASLVALSFLLAASALADEPAATFAPPEASVTVASGDTLVQYIEHTSARVLNGKRVYRLTLRPGTSRATANRLADFVAEDGDPGSLTILGDGFSVERSTIRLGTIPLPPPPPRAKRPSGSSTDGSGTPQPPPPPERRGAGN